MGTIPHFDSEVKNLLSYTATVRAASYSTKKTPLGSDVFLILYRSYLFADKAFIVTNQHL